MADIGLSGTGLGIASLALQVGDSIMRLKSFWDAVRNAPEEIEHLIEEIHTLSLVLSDFETSNSAQPELNIGTQTTSRCLELCKSATGVLENVVSEVEKEIQKRKRVGSVKAVLKKPMIEKLRERLMTAQSMLMLSNNLYLVDLQKRNQQAHHDWAKSHQQELRELKAIVSQSTEITLSKSFQTCNSVSTAAGVDSPCLQPTSLITRERKKDFQIRHDHSKLGLKLRARLKTPTWLFGVSRAIEFYDSRARAGWTFTIQVYNIVPHNSPQFEMAENGDVAGIQQLFSTREASPFDRTETGVTLLDMAAIEHDLNMCRLLQNEGADPKISRFGTALVAACRTRDGFSGSYGLNDIVLHFAQDLELLDPCEGTSVEGDWVYFRGSLETFSWLLEASNSTHKDRSLEECTLFALKVCGSQTREMSRLVRLVIDGREISKKMCSIRERRHDMTLLHYATRNLGSYFSIHYDQGPRSEDVQHLCGLIQDLVRGGSDLHALTQLDLTPMLGLLRNYMSHFLRSTLDLQLDLGDIKSIYIWLTALHTSGMDLELYGREEKRLLVNGCVSRQWWCNVFDHSRILRRHCWLRLVNFTYGPEPSDWRFWIIPEIEPYFVDFWEMVDHPERAMPGAWEDGVTFNDRNYYNG